MPSATETRSDPPGATPGRDQTKLPLPTRADFNPCLRKGGATVSSKLSKQVPSAARDESKGAFTVTFPDGAFGPNQTDVAFLPFERPAVFKKVFAEIKPDLGTRRVMLRPNLIVLYGSINTQKASRLVGACVDKGIEGK